MHWPKRAVRKFATSLRRREKALGLMTAKPNPTQEAQATRVSEDNLLEATAGKVQREVPFPVRAGAL